MNLRRTQYFYTIGSRLSANHKPTILSGDRRYQILYNWHIRSWMMKSARQKRSIIICQSYVQFLRRQILDNWKLLTIAPGWYVHIRMVKEFVCYFSLERTINSTQTLPCGTKTVRGSISRMNQKVLGTQLGKWVLVLLGNNVSVGSEMCTWHGSVAVGTCTKLRPDPIMQLKIRGNYLHKIWIVILLTIC